MTVRSFRPTPSFIVALLALFVALGGTGYATFGVHGSMIAERSIAGAKLKDQTVTSRKLKSVDGSKLIERSVPGTKLLGNTLTGEEIDETTLVEVPLATLAVDADVATRAETAAAADRATHAETADSAAQSEDAAALNGVPAASYMRFGAEVPSGTTITGAWGVFEANVTANQALFGVVSLPASMAGTPSASSVNFAPLADNEADDDDGICMGTPESPAAPPGKLCLYRSVDGNAHGYGGYLLGSGIRNGFSVRVRATADGNVDTRGTWAYTAP